MEVKMSPTLKRYTKITSSILCAIAFWNCSHHSSDASYTSNDSATSELTNVALSLKYSTTPLLDSLVLDCYGTDTLHYVHSVDNALFDMKLFPSDSWKFIAKIYANGALMQQGELETKLTAGSTVNLSIQMHPVVGFFYVEIPLGLKNDAGISGGTMILSSGSDRYEIPMETTTEGGYFRSDMLKLGCEYNVEIALYNSDGETIYSLTDKFTLTEDSPIPALSLNSLQSDVAVAIQAAEERVVEVTLPLKAGFRSPRTDDLLITEFLVSPDSKDSSQYEFIEIYNGSIDTLILDDCSIGVTSSGSLKYVTITASEIEPGKVMVLGDTRKEAVLPNHINTDGWNDIVGTKGSLVLKCNGETLDSLYYSSTIDSLQSVIPVSSKAGISTQLDLDLWEDRADSSAWCLAEPTPGELTFCE